MVMFFRSTCACNISNKQDSDNEADNVRHTIKEVETNNSGYNMQTTIDTSNNKWEGWNLQTRDGSNPILL